MPYTERTYTCRLQSLGIYLFGYHTRLESEKKIRGSLREALAAQRHRCFQVAVAVNSETSLDFDVFFLYRFLDAR